MKGVIRIDSKYTHGWQGRVSYQGDQCTKFFADRKNGGSEAAEQRCARWVAKTTRAFGMPVVNCAVFTVANSNTGHVGVYRDRRGRLIARASLAGNQPSKMFRKRTALATVVAHREALFARLTRHTRSA